MKVLALALILGATSFSAVAQTTITQTKKGLTTTKIDYSTGGGGGLASDLVTDVPGSLKTTNTVSSSGGPFHQPEDLPKPIPPSNSARTPAAAPAPAVASAPAADPETGGPSSQNLQALINASQAKVTQLQADIKLWDERIQKAQSLNRQDLVKAWENVKTLKKQQLSSEQASLQSLQAQLMQAKQSEAIAAAQRVEQERLRQQNALQQQSRAQLALLNQKPELPPEPAPVAEDERIKRLPASVPAAKGAGGDNDINQELRNNSARSL